MDKEQEVKTDDLNTPVDEVNETTKEVSGETEVTLETQIITLIELVTSMNEKLDTLAVSPEQTPEQETEQEQEQEQETIELSEDELKSLDDDLQGV